MNRRNNFNQTTRESSDCARKRGCKKSKLTGGIGLASVAVVFLMLMFALTPSSSAMEDGGNQIQIIPQQNRKTE